MDSKKEVTKPETVKEHIKKELKNSKFKKEYKKEVTWLRKMPRWIAHGDT